MFPKAGQFLDIEMVDETAIIDVESDDKEESLSKIMSFVTIYDVISVT